MDANHGSGMTRTAPDEEGQPLSSVPGLPERFVPIRLLGRGGQGEVWLAHDGLLGQKVALKVIAHPEGGHARARVVKEARLGRELSHPSLIRVFDLIELPDSLIVVMEWMPAGSLKQALREGPLPVTRVVAIAERLLDALAFLHGRGVVHRDVKPSNLLADREGGVRLADLGLVRELDGVGGLTRTGMTVGTPDYMSPEQLRGERVGPPSDLYSLGVTLFELITGARPFAGTSDFDIANRHLTLRPRDPRRLRPACPRWLAGFILRLLEKDPRHRWSDATAARASFGRRSAPRWRRWRRAAAVAAGLLAAAAAVLAAQRQLGAHRLTSASIAGAEVVASDRLGRELWRRTFDWEPYSVVAGDFVGSGDSEVAVVLTPGGKHVSRKQSVIVVLDASGRELTRIDWLAVRDVVLSYYYPTISDDWGFSELYALDLDGDGGDELVWTRTHPDWYPTAVSAWWGRQAGRVQTLLVNSGRVHSLRPADLDGDGTRELVVSATNNPIGYQDVVAIVEAGAGSTSPDLLIPELYTAMRSYVPLGQGAALPEIADASPAGILLRRPQQLLQLTASGSRADREADLDGAAWMAFWRDLTVLCRDVSLRPDLLDHHRAGFAADHAQALREPGARLASDLLLARSLAQVGAHAPAIALLRTAAERDPEHGDLWLRLGEQLLVTGRRDAGRRALVRSLTGRGDGRSAFDATLLLELDAALHPRGATAAAPADSGLAFGSTSFPERITAKLAPVRAFLEADWSDPVFDTVDDDRIFKGMAVMRLWARWQRGEPAPAVAAASQRLEANPETADQARLLRSLCLLDEHRAPEARALAREALQHLDQRGQESYEAFFWVPLAEWAYGTALEASGRTADARAHLERAATLAPDTWFGRAARRTLGR